ncbi:UNVERIFIED_CONTAM: hypothetical protein HDU68_012492 [Siphonaria sp. JEL0065]|nr:hypothetical protein HDU68_012492 [Siphonaria sp. JEL0065]
MTETSTIEDSFWELKWLISNLASHANNKSSEKLLDADYHTLPALQPSLRLANKTRFSILAKALAPLPIESHRKLETWTTQRAQSHKPLQYILGTQPFADLDIKLRPPTLIPRWETEEWTMRVVDIVKNHQPQQRVTNNNTPTRILDFCTGTGCIALALAHHLPNPKVIGFDISKRAIQLSKLNARRNGVELKERVWFQQIDLLDEELRRMDGSCDRIRELFEDAFGPQSVVDVDDGNRWVEYIVSNPPYIPLHEYRELDKSVREWEDVQALLGVGNDGLGFYSVIAELASRLLKQDSKSRLPRERVFLEIGGSEQVPGVVDALMRNGFSETEVWKDLAGKDRVVVGKI